MFGWPNTTIAESLVSPFGLCAGVSGRLKCSINGLLLTQVSGHDLAIGAYKPPIVLWDYFEDLIHLLLQLPLGVGRRALPTAWVRPNNKVSLTITTPH
jgi:hypothetical protein